MSFSTLLLLFVASVSARPSTWEINMNSSASLYGDMLLTPRQRQRYENAAISVRHVYRKETSVNRWKNNTVPFVLAREYSQNQQQLLRRSFAGLEAVSCFHFVERTNERDYLYIAPLDGCYSYVGKIGGKQLMSLAIDCLADYIIWHEIMHALGFEHEHQRPDRDQWIRVEYRNVQPGQMVNFEKILPNEVDFPDRYDYKSIMHYDGYAFGRKENGRRLATMVPLRKGILLNDNMELSSTDILKLQRLGNCNTKRTHNYESSSCADKMSSCPDLASKGFCSSPQYSSSMALHCAKTCGKCEEGEKRGRDENCEDHPGTNCAGFKKQCSMEVYSPLMTALCPKTCGKCEEARMNKCTDLDANCPSFASNGFCRNEVYGDERRLRCAKTCGLC